MQQPEVGLLACLTLQLKIDASEAGAAVFGPSIIPRRRFSAGWSWSSCINPNQPLPCHGMFGRPKDHIDASIRDLTPKTREIPETKVGKILNHDRPHIPYTIYYKLYTTYYILYTVYYILHTIYYILCVIVYILYTIYYILYTTYYILYIMCYILYTIYYTIYTIPFAFTAFTVDAVLPLMFLPSPPRACAASSGILRFSASSTAAAAAASTKAASQPEASRTASLTYHDVYAYKSAYAHICKHIYIYICTFINLCGLRICVHTDKWIDG